MRKVNSKSIYILLFFIGIIQGHAKAHENDSILFLNQDLKQIFDSFPYGKDIASIDVLFYTIGKNHYLMLHGQPQHEPYKSKGYFLYKNYILSYYGMDDKIAARFINLNLLQANDTTNFKRIASDWDILPLFFKINKRQKLIEFTPNKKHSNKLHKILLNEKLVEDPPPPPPY